MRASRRGILGAGLGAAGLLPACAGARVIGLDKSARTLDIANGGEPLSLDPHKCTGQWENNIVGDMFVGLTTENQRAEPIPGMAESWETSTDGLTWTFYLRRATWSDGEACDAHDFEFAFQRILDPEALSEYASVLYPILNAEAVNSGRMSPQTVGVRALDDLTLEIQLAHPAPYLPQLLKHYASFPVPKHVVEAHRDRWTLPEHIVVNGPYTLKRWWSNYVVHLVRNPRYYDNARIHLEQLYFYPSTDVQAAARSVLSGERGWATKFPSNQVDELRADLPDYVHVAPWLQVTYFSFNTTRPPFDDVRLRQALSMALDREFIATKIYRTGERPAYALVPPGIANYPGTARYPWAGQSLEERRAEALRLLREAGYGPNNPLRFEFSHRNTSDNPRVAVIAQANWRAIAPWVICELAAVETQIHYQNLRVKNFQIGDGGWIADFNDAKNYLYLLETRTGANNYAGYSNPEFDRLAEAADFEPDVDARAELMSQAEQLALNDAPICTCVFLSSTNLVHPDITGYSDNLEDIHRARWFGVKA
jgi:oligopeptide transport system substrate-binding protein